MQRTLLIFIALFFLAGCKKPNEVTKSFYYWKTTYSLTNQEEKLLSNVSIKKLYVHCFDVNYIPEKAASFPVGKITFEKNLSSKCEIVPVIYIVNDVFIKMHSSNIPELAKNVFTLIESINTKNYIQEKEIQFDCDWTDATQKKYFSFLEEIKKLIGNKIQLSATIRLHQIKYKRRTGIPPVERGMLMFYNMGTLKAYGPQNSIYDFDIAKSYADYISGYPLPLDYALPVFSWAIWSRNGKILGLINSVADNDLAHDNRFQMISPHLFVVKEGTFYRGKYLFKGDTIFVEEITPEITGKAINQLLPEINSTKFTVAFYHLDSTLFKNYDQQKIENLFSRFN